MMALAGTLKSLFQNVPVLVVVDAVVIVVVVAVGIACGVGVFLGGASQNGLKSLSKKAFAACGVVVVACGVSTLSAVGLLGGGDKVGVAVAVDEVDDVVPGKFANRSSCWICGVMLVLLPPLALRGLVGDACGCCAAESFANKSSCCCG